MSSPVDARLTPPSDDIPATSRDAAVNGLTSATAAQRLVEHGPNEIVRDQRTSWATLLLRQFSSPVIWLLVGASVVSALVGELLDAAAIGAIVVINAVIGYLQENHAEGAVFALRSMTAPQARVRRDGRNALVPASGIVPGDVLVLEAGDITAADARLLTVHALAVNEASLTGESVPVEKQLSPTTPDTPLAERHDFVFMGTSIAAGTALAEVVATGMRTELGRIAHLLSSTTHTVTPLQQRLARVSRTLLLICGVIVAVVAGAGLVRGWPPLQVFMAAVSLAVAAVPEGLPAIVTIALAVGVQRMAKRQLLVRHLPAVETLGCVTVICTDKTGTLTTGVMAARELWGPDQLALLGAAAACADAELGLEGRPGVGDPTEIAILAAAFERGIRREDIEQRNPRVTEQPFDQALKRMSITRADGKVYIKGAAESVLPLCDGDATSAQEANARMAGSGLRVLAVAVAPSGTARASLLGLIGLADPPRPEAIAAVADARRAGITTVMITGDHAGTARAIAHELGILADGDDEQRVVHARATPEDKIRIVEEWKARGAIVVMTGDGVNDAPAVRAAHVGIAMGRTGTEVTREASAMVLADDNFASIIAAVREGRGIFDNIRKALVYLLAGNTGELLVMLIAAVSGLPLPLLPLQLLWVNVVTDGLPALALVVDPADPDVLLRPPRDPTEPILGKREWQVIFTTGLLQTATTLGIFVWALRARDLSEARNLAFSTLVFGELFRAFAARSPTRLFWEVGAFTNLRLLAVVVLSVVMQLVLHHTAIAQRVLAIKPLSLNDCILTLLVALIPVTLTELSKLLRRRNSHEGPQAQPRRSSA